jgi:hypothetical protein
MRWIPLLWALGPLVASEVACNRTPQTPEAVMDAVKPVIDRALSRAGQTPKPATAADVARFSKPFDVTPQVHYLLNLSGKEAALSIYYLGDDDARTMPLIQQLSKASSDERAAGLAVAYHLHTHNKKGFYAHLTTGRGSEDAGLQTFLQGLFSPSTTGMEIGKALR